MSWIERDIESALKERAGDQPVLVLTGSRQTGKTSLLERVFPSHLPVSLDLPRLAQQAEEDGESFLAAHPPPGLIDEVQYAPRLFRHLKSVVESHRRKPGQYVLTGSQKFTLMAGVSESLAGRVSLMELHSLSARELEAWSGRRAEGAALLEWIWKGGYPDLHARNRPPGRFFSDYVATYLERDVRQLVKVRDLRDFDRFLRLTALRTGQLLSMNSLASDLGVSPNTVRSWLSVLEASNIVCLLEPYFENFGKRIVKTPKVYFLDTGLACFLAGIATPEELAGSGLLGAFFETFVLGQIVRSWANRGENRRIYFWRDHYGHEVDFVIPAGNKLKLIESKWGDAYDGFPVGFAEIEKQAGSHRIHSKHVVTSRRGPFRGRKFSYDDVVALRCLES